MAERKKTIHLICPCCEKECSKLVERPAKQPGMWINELLGDKFCRTCGARVVRPDCVLGVQRGFDREGRPNKPKAR